MCPWRWVGWLCWLCLTRQNWCETQQITPSRGLLHIHDADTRNQWGWRWIHTHTQTDTLGRSSLYKEDNASAPFAYKHAWLLAHKQHCSSSHWLMHVRAAIKLPQWPAVETIRYSFLFMLIKLMLTDCNRLKQALVSKWDLPDGEFLSFDSILKSFFSSSVKNLLSPQSGQHPSTVFTSSPLLLALVLSLVFPSISFFSPSCFLSHRKAVAGGGCGLDSCPTLRLSTVNRKLEPESPWSQVCCYTNKAEDRHIMFFVKSGIRPWYCK